MLQYEPLLLASYRKAEMILEKEGIIITKKGLVTASSLQRGRVPGCHSQCCTFHFEKNIHA
jgi:hypothetical protein